MENFKDIWNVHLLLTFPEDISTSEELSDFLTEMAQVDSYYAGFATALFDNGVLEKLPELNELNGLEKLFNNLKDLPDEDLQLYNECKAYLDSLKKVAKSVSTIRQKY